MSYYFDGIDDHLYTSAPVNTLPFTMMVWVKYADIYHNIEQNPMGTSDNGTVNFALIGSFNYYIRASTRMGSSPSWTANTGVLLSDQPDGWHCWIYEVTSDTLQESYWDGTAIKGIQSSDAGTFNANYVHLSIGALKRSTTSNYFKGWIAHSTVWNTGLSDDEINALAIGANPLKVANANVVFYESLLATTSLTVVGAPFLDNATNPAVTPIGVSIPGRNYANGEFQSPNFTELSMPQAMRICSNNTVQFNKMVEIAGAPSKLYANGTYACPQFIEQTAL